MEGRLGRIIHGVRLVEDALVVVLVLAMILLAAGQILLRNFWGVGAVWADPLLRVMVLWVGLLGAMAATRHNNHITVDVLSRFLSPRLKRISQWLTGLFASGVCAVLAWHGARFVAMEYEAGTLVFAGLPAWCCELIIPLGFGVMALRFFVVTVWPAAEPA
ncbi:TRAP transporter small permease [Sulfurivermis fontis]|uniref:TRAP transporter small permease n=1 Tax=Sulfurivermis fontis TaxID=1972068 RepID=UPI0018D4FD35|nr:TRAP transporter small permease subunit [Sulfurivermis fontis]